MTSSKGRVVVIGGGLGGLAVAVRLAAAGRRVTVLEQGKRVGGKMNRWEAAGYRFDTGPSLITLPDVFRETFAAAGANLDDYLTLTRVHPHAEYRWPDGFRLTYSTDLPEWLETLRRHSPRDVDGFLRFMALGAKLYALSDATFLRRSPYEPPGAGTLRETFAALRHFPLGGWGNYHRTVEAHFESPRLVQMMDRYPTYVGSSPYRSPATLAVIPYLEYAFGAWYPEGGLYRIVEALAEVAEGLGVEIRTGTRATAVEGEGGALYEVGAASYEVGATSSGGPSGEAPGTPYGEALGTGREVGAVSSRASSRGRPWPRGAAVAAVRLESGETLPADVVVMNGDASRLGHGAGGLAPEERSLSGFVLLLAVKRPLPEIAHHTVCFSGDYRAEFRQLIEERRFPDDPTVYVSAPSRSDRSLVPGDGGEALFVMANAPANGDPMNRGGGAWGEAETEEARRRIFARLRASGFPDLEAREQAEALAASTVWTPSRLAAAYDMPGGAIYGRCSHGWRGAFLRPPNRAPRARGLYYVGGSTHPGGGTPTVLLSAKITARMVEGDSPQ